MDRLTGRRKNGDPYFKKCFEDPCNGNGSTSRCDDCDFLIDVGLKLAHYEDLEEQLEKTYGECDGLLKEIVDALSKTSNPYIGKPKKSVLLTDGDAEKWIQWKESEEHGKLIKFPCKPGDTLYNTQFVSRSEGWDVFPFKVNYFQVTEAKGKIKIYIYFEGTPGNALCDVQGNLDEGWYLTEQEAKEALEGMKNG